MKRSALSHIIKWQNWNEIWVSFATQHCRFLRLPISITVFVPTQLIYCLYKFYYRPQVFIETTNLKFKIPFYISVFNTFNIKKNTQKKISSTGISHHLPNILVWLIILLLYFKKFILLFAESIYSLLFLLSVWKWQPL